MKLATVDSSCPVPWATVTGASGQDPGWYAAGAVEFVRKAAPDALAALKGNQATNAHGGVDPAARPSGEVDLKGSPGAAPAHPTLAGLPPRERPLLALPVVGTGAGGAEGTTGEVCKALITQLAELLSKPEIQADVVIVAWHADTYAALQAVRREAQGEQWPCLDWALRDRADELATLASDGKLVVFVGAGVSMGAGLPGWGALLKQLWAAVEETARPEGFAELDCLDQAQLLERYFASQRPSLGERVARLISEYDRHAVTHALLANLPVREFVTTNYDGLLELAAAGMKADMVALPHEASREQERWVLKLHGCVSNPSDIVLSRRSYLRYAARHEALAGIVQALLITRQMLFVGFGMVDDNFVRIVDAVQRAIDVPPEVAATNCGELHNGEAATQAPAQPNRVTVKGDTRPIDGSGPRLGYTTWLSDATPLEHLWRGELGWIKLTGDALEPARKLEIMLDRVACQTTGPAHVLSPRQEGALGDGMGKLREALTSLRKVADEQPHLPGMARVRRLLREFGADLTPAGEGQSG